MPSLQPALAWLGAEQEDAGSPRLYHQLCPSPSAGPRAEWEHCDHFDEDDLFGRTPFVLLAPAPSGGGGGAQAVYVWVAEEAGWDETVDLVDGSPRATACVASLRK